MKNKFIRIGSALVAFVLAFVLLVPQLPLADAVTTENGQTVYNLGDFYGYYNTSFYSAIVDGDSTRVPFDAGELPLSTTCLAVPSSSSSTSSAYCFLQNYYFYNFDDDTASAVYIPAGTFISVYVKIPEGFWEANRDYAIFRLVTSYAWSRSIYVYRDSILSTNASSTLDSSVCDVVLNTDGLLESFVVQGVLKYDLTSITFSQFAETGYRGSFATTYSSYDDLVLRVGTPTDPDPEPSTPTTPGITLVNNPDSNGVFTVFEGEQYTQSIDITNANGTPSANVVIDGTRYPMTITAGLDATTYRATYTGFAGPPGTQQLSYEVFNELNGETASAVSDNYTLQSFVVPTVPTINVVGGETTTWDVILGQAVDFSVFGEGVNANGLVGLYVNGQLIADKVAALEYGVSSWSHTFQFTPEAVGDYEIYAVIDNNSGGLNVGRTESAQTPVITLHVVEPSALPDWLTELKQWLVGQLSDTRSWAESWYKAINDSIQEVVEAVKALGGGIASIPDNVTNAVEEVTGKVEEITDKLSGVAGREDELVGDAYGALDAVPPDVAVTPTDPVTGEIVDYTVVQQNVVLTLIFDFAPVKGMLIVYSAFLVINAVFLGKWWGAKKEKG